VTTAKRPSFRVRDGVGCKGVSIGGRNEIFLRMGLDGPNQIESFQQITVYVDTISEAPGPGKRGGVQHK
jgi:hypothetical protein